MDALSAYLSDEDTEVPQPEPQPTKRTATENENISMTRTKKPRLDSKAYVSKKTPLNNVQGPPNPIEKLLDAQKDELPADEIRILSKHYSDIPHRIVSKFEEHEKAVNCIKWSRANGKKFHHEKRGKKETERMKQMKQQNIHFFSDFTISNTQKKKVLYLHLLPWMEQCAFGMYFAPRSAVSFCVAILLPCEIFNGHWTRASASAPVMIKQLC
jgi:hypothetical protein